MWTAGERRGFHGRAKMSDAMSAMSWLPARAANPMIAALGEELFLAQRGRHVAPPITERGLGLDIDDAYAISVEFLRRRLETGERVVGKKIGVTSKAVQDMLGVHQPDFGFLTDAMRVDDGATIDLAAKRLIQPRVEAEIAFLLKRDIDGPDATEADVLDATLAVVPCFEIVDSRIQDWKIGIVDTIADNASCGVFVLGEARVDPRRLDLPGLKVRVRKNGVALSEGLGSAVQGSPLTAVAWLARTLGAYGVPLLAGDVILSGSLVPLEPAQAGDRFEMDLEGVGPASVRFA
jgi:2-oxopent-4-enoate/cis-2-oxohex-4-enoate hydratase